MVLGQPIFHIQYSVMISCVKSFLIVNFNGGSWKIRNLLVLEIPDYGLTGFLNN